ncbi:hypothetical protein QTH89_07780 [Variovorax sp. J22G21]|uniref:hypothetical protein n=1 Tax=Variovorax fucosicus TaxID=3053517 RepID=UPI00257603A6|nr:MULTISPECIES: hypothetical protein [unclassified Variovorax]MDM0061096.1 hypothetical protein [Variovorax sp. J22G21]
MNSCTAQNPLRAGRLAASLLALCLVSQAMPAFARDTRWVLPINPVMQQPATREALGNDVQLRFADAPQANVPPGQVLTVEGYARPYSRAQRTADGRPVIRSDEETCREAMRNTLVALVAAARARGVRVVTQVESFYDDQVLPTPGAYECHAGIGSAVVQLRGLAGGDGGSAVGAAGVDDVNAVPGLSADGRAAYQKFLQSKPPRAFVIRQAGDRSWFAWADGAVPRDINRPSDPTQRALEYCRERSQGECSVYAVDYAVVYRKPMANAPEAGAAFTAPVASRYRLPADSHFADVNDASLVPVGDRNRDGYFKFLALPMPRAYAIAADGSAAFASGSAAMADVLNTCEREGKTCWLYAVDDRVVWQTDLRQRIGRVNQLSRVQQEGRTP